MAAAWYYRHYVRSHLEYSDMALAPYLSQNTVRIDAYALPGGHTLQEWRPWLLPPTTRPLTGSWTQQLAALTP